MVGSQGELDTIRVFTPKQVLLITRISVQFSDLQALYVYNALYFQSIPTYGQVIILLFPSPDDSARLSERRGAIFLIGLRFCYIQTCTHIIAFSTKSGFSELWPSAHEN